MDARFAKASSDPRFSKNYARSAATTDVRFLAAPPSKKRARPPPSGAAAAPKPAGLAAAPGPSLDPRFARGAAWGQGEAMKVDAEEEEEEEGGEEEVDGAGDAEYLQALAEAGGQDALGEGVAPSTRGGRLGGGKRGESVEARLARLSAASRGLAEFSGSDGEGGSTDEEGEQGGREEDVEALLLALDGEEVVVDPDAPDLAAVEHTTLEGGESTRIAIVNLDWAQVRAVDVHAVLQSCVPARGGGSLLRVTIYPSDYGLARMEEEAREGPVRLLRAAEAAAGRKAAAASGRSGKGAPLLLGGSSRPKHGGMAAVEEEEKDNTDPAVLRAYELNKLKYFYAVAEFDRAETAAAVYSACDGLEFEDSSNVMDLRFVPEGTVFANAPRDVSVHVPEDYEACVGAVGGGAACGIFSPLSNRTSLSTLPTHSFFLLSLYTCTLAPACASAAPTFPRARCSPRAWRTHGMARTLSAAAPWTGTG